jgi:hypothetical protein
VEHKGEISKLWSLKWISLWAATFNIHTTIITTFIPNFEYPHVNCFTNTSDEDFDAGVRGREGHTVSLIPSSQNKSIAAILENFRAHAVRSRQCIFPVNDCCGKTVTMNRGPLPILKRLPYSMQIAFHWTFLDMPGKQAKHYLNYCVYYTNSEYTYSLYCILSYRIYQDYR